MDEVKIIEIKKSVFADNEKDAEALRQELKDKRVYLLNLMSSPGSGKTTTLIRTINLLKDRLRIAVMEADIDSDVDAVSYTHPSRSRKPRASNPSSSTRAGCATSMPR